MGDDFRPGFRLMAELKTYFWNVKFLALKAKARRDAQSVIASHLEMKNSFLLTARLPGIQTCVLLCKRVPSPGGDNSVKGTFDFFFKPPFSKNFFNLKKGFPLHKYIQSSSGVVTKWSWLARWFLLMFWNRKVICPQLWSIMLSNQKRFFFIDFL